MEQMLITTKATVLLYDDEQKRWAPSSAGGQIPAVAKVQLLQNVSNNSFRVVARRIKDHEVVLNVAIHRSVKFNQSTPLFHQWKDAKQVYGLQYELKEEAEAFGGAMSQVIQFLQQVHAQQKATQGGQTALHNTDAHLYSPCPNYQLSSQSSVSSHNDSGERASQLNPNAIAPAALHSTCSLPRGLSDANPYQQVSKSNNGSSVQNGQFALPAGVNVASLDSQQLQLLVALQQNGMLVATSNGSAQNGTYATSNASQTPQVSAPSQAAPPPPPPPPPAPAIGPPKASANGAVESDSNNNAFAAALSNTKLRSIGRSATVSDTPVNNVSATLPRRDSQAALRSTGDAMMDEMKQRIEARNKRQTFKASDGTNGANGSENGDANGFFRSNRSSDKNFNRPSSPTAVNGVATSKSDALTVTMGKKEFDELKSELLIEMRKEVQKMKLELLDAIKMELIRK